MPDLMVEKPDAEGRLHSRRRQDAGPALGMQSRVSTIQRIKSFKEDRVDCFAGVGRRARLGASATDLWLAHNAGTEPENGCLVFCHQNKYPC